MTEIKTRELVYDGFHKIERIQVMLKGELVERERLILRGAVAAILMDTIGRMALVSQFRPAAGKQLWEVPAGIMDKPHLDARQTMIEEIEEECGVEEEAILFMSEQPVRKYYMMPGSSDAEMHFFHAVSLPQKNKLVDDVDVDEVKWFTLEEVDAMIESGEIADSKTLIAYDIAKSGKLTKYPAQ